MLGRVFNRLMCAVVGSTLLICFGQAEAEGGDEEWQFALTPYLWLPTIDGVLSYQEPPSGGGASGDGLNVNAGPTDWFDLLNFGLLVSGTAQKGRFSISSDFVYLSMTSKNEGQLNSVGDGSNPGVDLPISGDLNLSTRTDLDGLQWSLTAGYALSQTETSTMDVFAGVRYFGLDVSTSWELTAEITAPDGSVVLPAMGGVATDTDIWDGIVGLRGEVGIGESDWDFLYSFDVGAGDSDLSWNAFSGFGREFGWGDLLIAYRHLEYDQDSSSLLQDFSFSGPLIGGRFRF